MTPEHDKALGVEVKPLELDPLAGLEVREVMPFEASPFWPSMVAAMDETMEAAK